MLVFVALLLISELHVRQRHTSRPGNLDTKFHLPVRCAQPSRASAPDGRTVRGDVNTNAHDDLWTSGRLSKLARSYGRGENETLGALMNVYRLTQRAKVAIESPARIATIVVLAFNDDDEADAFLSAMVRAQLASIMDDGRMSIHGNAERIKQQDDWEAEHLKRSIAGGKARAAECKRDASGQFKKLNDLPAGDQPGASQKPASIQPSLSLSKSLGSDLRSTCVQDTISEDVSTTAPQTRAIDPVRGKPLAPFVLAEFRRSALEFGRPIPENHDTKDTWAASTIVTKYPDAWKAIIARYHTDEFYGRYGWSLQNLAKNLDQIANRRDPPDERAKTDADYLAIAKQKLGY